MNDDSTITFTRLHAVSQGYKQQMAYIIAQNPLKSTVRNFWKVIVDRKCAAIVMLSNVEENGKVTGEVKCGKLVLSLKFLVNLRTNFFFV